MADKKIMLLIGFLLITAGIVGLLLIEHDNDTKLNENKAEINAVQPEKTSANHIKPVETTAQKTDLYSEAAYYTPLSSIAELAEIPAETKKKIDHILEISSGCYFIKQNPATKDIYIFLQNPVTDMSERYTRHNLQIAHIDENGNVSYEDIGYCGEYGEITNAVILNKNEEWVFDETVEPNRPINHVAFDTKNNILYSESWNYDETEPLKYEMKNSAGKIISVMKEYTSGDSGYRQEHIFYDDNGNTVKSITISYEGADIVWFTYYDSNLPDNSITIESIYNNGIKTSEKIYNQAYQLVKSFAPEYTNGSLTSLKVYNSDGKEVSHFIEK